jgi:2-polyprenyl-6-methoxyphenol hydroxylase-like FAD-dependent oxidoreductase
MFQHSLVIDMRRRTVTLPKLCEMFRNDFGGINTSTGTGSSTGTGTDITGGATSTSVSQERSQQERGLEVLRFILRYLERESWEKVTLLLNGPKPPVVKFQEMEARSHDSLQLMTSPELTKPDRVSVAAAAAATTRPMPAQGK